MFFNIPCFCFFVCLLVGWLVVWLVCWFVGCFFFVYLLACLFVLLPFLIEKIVSKCKSDCCILMFFILYREQCDREQAIDDFKTGAVFMYILKLIVLKALSLLH